ncbi:hypothetical protein [Phocaeicola abscessus]|nr:hypothetical protein [Phocaeicola abscessus]
MNDRGAASLRHTDRDEYRSLSASITYPEPAKEEVFTRNRSDLRQV